MTRTELDILASFLRARLRAPVPRGPRAAATAATTARRLRAVEQAVVGIEAYLLLAAHHPAPPGLPIEEQRARALWQTLLDLAALWPDHPDRPSLPSPPS
ncbi:hypothetical protein, partial [Streptacidiphilus melanogenes]|uniref:hypothetical protein n=1 Tax=Streptacidiphilus melanogenes TaxID=411235 RepID=UPI0005A6E921